MWESDRKGRPVPSAVVFQSGIAGAWRPSCCSWFSCYLLVCLQQSPGRIWRQRSGGIERRVDTRSSKQQVFSQEAADVCRHLMSILCHPSHCCCDMVKEKQPLPVHPVSRAATRISVSPLLSHSLLPPSPAPTVASAAPLCHGLSALCCCLSGLLPALLLRSLLLLLLQVSSPLCCSLHCCLATSH